MPLINGQKMACVPCIRGHRSTKCNHAADRVMVPVRKPGRPLSSCACPPGQSCACGGIKVAIPRKQKCKCGLDTTDGDHDGHDAVNPDMPTPAPTPGELPTSPTRTGVFRVQKPASSARQNGRKQSYDPALLDRIDPSQVNVVHHYHTMDGGIVTNGINGIGSTTPVSGMAFVQALPVTEYQQSPINTYAPPLGYALVPIQPHLRTPTIAPVPNHQSELASPHKGVVTPATNSSVRSCCAPAPVLPPKPQQIVQIPRQNGVAKSSCCGGGSDDAPNPVVMSHQRTMSNGCTMTQLQPSLMDLKQQQPFPVSYPHPTIFTYPPNYGTWAHPLNPATWAQLQQTPQPQPNGAGFPDSMPMTPNGGSQGLGTSHECSCGPGCQCVGCLAHPFNPQTLQYVGGAWDYDVDLPYGSNNLNEKHSNGSPVINGDETPAPVPHTNGHGTNGHTANGAQQPANYEAQSPQAQTPSDASGFEELSASDFMFVNLPLYQSSIDVDEDGNPCPGNSAYCPCGDDCQCDGCFVHNARPLGFESMGKGMMGE